MISKILRKSDYFIPIEHILNVKSCNSLKDSKFLFTLSITTLDLDKDILLGFTNSEECESFKKDLLSEIDEFHGLC